jgi:endonuclease/exonuclease/phosphatase family metal-dependent hydrolase
MAQITAPQSKETISVASYNCLANDYLHYWNGKLTPAQQSYTQQPGQRLSDVVQRIQQLNADVVCLQEISASESTAYTNLLGYQGYVGVYEQFANKPDGVAIYIKAAKFKAAIKDVLPYSDTTGRKALFLHLTTHQGAEVDVVSTHFQGGAQNRTTANSQIQDLVQKVQQTARRTVVCADCNFTPEDPRFQAMNQHFYDTLNGQSIPTSMNDKTPLRLDYIWHTAFVSPVSATVCGNIHQFLTSAEPSDHVPLLASFDLSVSAPQSSPSSTESYSLNVRNKYPGTDLNPSFKRKIFNAFNAFFLKLYFPQNYYDQIAPRFEAMIDRADLADQSQKGSFLSELYNEIALHSADAAEISMLQLSFAEVVNTQNRVSTIISTTFVVPPGKTLAVSGTGPLGNWDRKVPLKSLGNNQWALTLDGQFPAFEYKFRLDDSWELAKNRPLQCGKKDDVSSIQF